MERRLNSHDALTQALTLSLSVMRAFLDIGGVEPGAHAKALELASSALALAGGMEG